MKYKITETIMGQELTTEWDGFILSKIDIRKQKSRINSNIISVNPLTGTVMQ